MEDKRAYEAFRVRQFAGPHPALQIPSNPPGVADEAATLNDSAALSGAQVGTAAADPRSVSLVPDHDRVILHFDVDCFYAQVEECRNPSLRGQPLAVTQKYLVVTANYPARAAGVTKLMGIAAAKEACPHLILVPGEDLTPYRAASRDIRAVLSRWGPTEKLGLDESWVDVTQEVSRRLATTGTTGAISNSSAWSGHLVSSDLQLTSHSRHRPMDLRAVQQQQQEEEARQHMQGYPAAVTSASDTPSWLPACELRLKLGAIIAAEMRQAVKQEAGFRCSAGISCSKLLSKLVSGLHKPDDQTIILPTHAQAFVAPLPVRALPGVGYKSDGLLKSWGVGTAADARNISKQQLIQGLGEKAGASLFLACRGVDPSAVVASGPPKSITVEDSFKACSTWKGVAQVLQVLVPDLLDRLHEDAQEFPQLQRTPSTLTVKWRKAGTGWARSSASVSWPAAAKLTACQQQQQTQAVDVASGSDSAAVALTAAATTLLKQHLPARGVSLTLLNIGATGFKSKAGPGVGGGIQQFLVPKHQTQQPHADGAAPGAHSWTQLQPATAGAAIAVAAGQAGAGDLLQQARAATEARRDYNRASADRRSSSSELPWSPPQTAASTEQQHARGGTAVAQQYATAGAGAAGPVAAARTVLSKRQERQLWELAMQQQQQPEQQQQLVQQQHLHQYNQQLPIQLPEACDGQAGGTWPGPQDQQQRPQQQQQQQNRFSAVSAPVVQTPDPQHPPSLDQTRTTHRGVQGCPDQPSAKRQRLQASSGAAASPAQHTTSAAAVAAATAAGPQNPPAGGVPGNSGLQAVSTDPAGSGSVGAQGSAHPGALAGEVVHGGQGVLGGEVVHGGQGVLGGEVVQAAEAPCARSADPEPAADPGLQSAEGCGVPLWLCTNLHSVEGWGLVACEMLEDFG